MPAQIVAVSISATKGVKKDNVSQARILVNFGLEGDAHAGDWHRQVSLLAMESIDKMRRRGLSSNREILPKTLPPGESIFPICRLAPDCAWAKRWCSR